MLERGQRVFFVLAIGLIAVVLATLGRLPPVVASHFDAAGRPNGWSSRPVYVLLLIAIGFVLPLGVTGLIHGLTRRGPGGWGASWWAPCELRRRTCGLRWGCRSTTARAETRWAGRSSSWHR